MARVKNADYKRSLQHEYIIQQIDPDTDEVLNTFKTIREATAYIGKTGVSPISLACNGKQTLAYGYKWKKVLKE